MSYPKFLHALRREMQKRQAAFLRQALGSAEHLSAAARACGMAESHFRRAYLSTVGEDDLYRSRAAAGRRAGRPRKAGR